MKKDDTSVILPEIFPDGSAVPADSRAARVVSLHRAVFEAAHQFAVNTVLTGLALIELKGEVGHGKWEEFCRQHMDGHGLSERHRRRYMEVAAKWKLKATRLKQLPEAADAESVRDVLAEMTDATTWQQLWLDFGLMRSRKPTGGAMATGPRDPERKHEAFVRLWGEMVGKLYAQAVKHKTHVHLSQIQWKEIHGLLIDIAKAVKECIR